MSSVVRNREPAPPPKKSNTGLIVAIVIIVIILIIAGVIITLAIIVSRTVTQISENVVDNINDNINDQINNRCISDSDCSAPTPGCKTSSGDCVECVSDTHCSGNTTDTICNTSTNLCVECVETTDCPTGAICSSGTCLCGLQISNVVYSNAGAREFEVQTNAANELADWSVFVSFDSDFATNQEVTFTNASGPNLTIPTCFLTTIVPSGACTLGSAQAETMYFKAQRNGGCESNTFTLTFGPDP